MPADAPQEVTQLLLAYSQGNPTVLDRLMPQVYSQLRDIAHRHLRNERRDHTFKTTDLVHEAYLGLVNQQQVTWQNRLHFFALASRAMRHILIDYARMHRAEKRGGGRPKTSLDDTTIRITERADELIALDEALTMLASVDERLAQVVEYRFFGGLTIEETASLLEVSSMTVTRDWQKAKAWLYRLLRAP